MADAQEQPFPLPRPRGADTSLAAVFALLFGLTPCLPGASLLAIALGVVGLRNVRRLGTPGRGLAITGIVLGSVSTVACSVPVASIAWILGGPGRHQDAYAIYEIDVATRAERLVVDLPGRDACPLYLPDGSIVFEHQEPGDAGFRSKHGDLYVVSADGTTKQLTSLPGIESSPTLAPDGDALAFLYGSADGRFHVGRLTLGDGAAPEPELLAPTELRLLDLEWAPAGEVLAVVTLHQVGAALRLHWIDLDAESPVYERITTTEGLGDTSESNPAWTPDGLYFTFARSIALLPSEPGQDIRTLLEEADTDDLQYRGERLFASVSHETERETGLYEATVTNGTLTLTPFLLHPDLTGCVEISPDLTRVLFSRRREVASAE